MELQFKEHFEKMRSQGDYFTFRGNVLLVELFEDIEESKGGIILATKSDQLLGLNAGKAKLAYVHMSANGYYDEETGEIEPLIIQPGAVVMCPASQLEYFTTFPGITSLTQNKLALIPETAIRLYYDNVEDYNKVKEVINAD